MNRMVLIAAGTLVVVGFFAFLFNTFTSSPLNPQPSGQTEETLPADETSGESTDSALIGGEAEGKPITNVAEAVQAIDDLDTAQLDAQIAADLAEIDASFE